MAPERRALLTWVAVACSLALFLPLAWPLARGMVFVYDDLANFHLPVRYLYRNALQAGDSVLWTPVLFSGFYLHGEGQAGMFHPLHWLLYRTLPLATAFNLEFLSSYVIGFSGMLLFLRRLPLSPPAAVSGAMLFAFGGFQLLHFHHMNVVAIAAHLPWLLAAVDLLMLGQTPARRTAGYAGIALVLGSAVLVGFPQGVWWNLLTGGSFTVLRASEHGRWRRAALCAIAAVTGVLIGGVQLLPTLDLAAHSTRATLSRAFALTFSLHPYNLLQLWAPYALAHRVYSATDYPFGHEFGLYSGALAVLAPLWLYVRRDAIVGFRLLAGAAAYFSGVMLILALGRYGGLDELLTFLPGLSSLRAPARYIVLVQFGLAVLSAIALEDLIRLPAGGIRLTRRAIVLLCLPAILSVATTMVLNTQVITFPESFRPSPLGRAAVGSALIVAATAALLAASRTRRALPLLMAIAALDLGCWGLSYVWRVPAVSIELAAGALPPLAAGVRYDWAPEFRDRPVLNGHLMSWSYAGLFPATPLAPDSDEFLRLAGTVASVAATGTVTPLRDPSPRAALDGNAGTARIVIDRPGHIVVSASATEQQRLILTERFDAGWTATVDGTTAQVLAIDQSFIGCRVPPGDHVVEFRFMPRSFVRGAFVSFAGLAALLAGVAVIRRSAA